ncbi:class I SAM-dependent methyltransferase [Agromyces kandeliae]|uniref:Methyltransferase n=1 Tax=Agromyces kandeliae TaxID=2666141 RepID=A0A6L5R1F9_9MICO|nr:methyltransferase [Agromyces kandeliae]MRX43792.1 methyltransferase [Agromyces kandeliae]
MAARPDHRIDEIASRLRGSGSVFAEDEAAILVAAAADDAELEQLVRRRTAGEPIEPLVGWVRFGSIRLAVGPGVFVPRQRSLRLARLAVRRVRAARAPVMLEAYCGVAPIAAAVAASAPAAEVHAADLDPAALAFARANLPEPAHVHLADALDGLPPRLRGRLTTIAAVPPYVPEAELALMPREARDHEPATALVGGGADGLGHVRRLVRDARPWLATGGHLLLELHAAQLPVAAGEGRAVGWLTRLHPPTASRTGVLELIAG